MIKGEDLDFKINISMFVKNYTSVLRLRADYN